MPAAIRKEHYYGAVGLWAGIFIAVLLWSTYQPKDWLTWWMEALPALIGFLLVLRYRVTVGITPLVYWLILLHCIVLMVGAHYTYAEVPLFSDLEHWLQQSRNNYDKVGHFLQGFVPVMIARELLLRQKVLSSKAWMNFFIVCFVLAFSAFYELVEWSAAMISETGAEAFLGTQGDEWDTQTDMLFALIGGIAALVTLSKLHDKQLLYFSNR
ncbi:DUF2238 domain-containing protein [Hydrogenovibrio marinus]|uniref:Membrane protein n=1 Tax=Hydrogenovibrio marinus TaxID=28885 RepID=A0A066ZN61_HYDMR|nr:DUF2238 domain-containing protein [Hydrogenovibrio marinus]KDN95233.1 membrane protein [Hydrogenovibrio marinus]BBN59710.1 membrane protein [Hydrogenovibrio marinus]